MAKRKGTRTLRHLSLESLDPRCLMAADMIHPLTDANVVDAGSVSLYHSRATTDARPVFTLGFNPDDYRPMPLPVAPSSGLREPAAGLGEMVVYDIATAKVATVGDSTPYTPQLSDRVLGAAGVVEGPSVVDPGGLAFSDLARVSNTANYPWSANVKEFFTFPNGQQYVCSGTLIDPLHVLTAGHCVYQASEGGWATSMQVVPGYDAGVQPFGYATATNLISWNGWTVNQSWDHDMAVVRLDRPVGALSGWYGYQYSSNPSFDLSSQFHNASYPAASPYDGQRMYYRYGFFDYVSSTGNQLGIQNQSYGGQSGSGAYYNQDGHRLVSSVLSNGNGLQTNFPRITPDKFGSIRDQVIGAATPSRFDLTPMSVQVEPAAVTAGSALVNLSYVVHNYASAGYSGPVNARVYLSTDDDITEADPLIDSHSFTYNFGPRSSVVVSLNAPPSIPTTVSSGDYWIGVVLDVADHDDGNNTTRGQDTTRLTVGGSGLRGDFDGDGAYTCADIDSLIGAIAAGSHQTGFDLTGDQAVDLRDRDAWLSTAGAFHLGPGRSYLLGDATLDGAVDVSDFGVWNRHKFTAGNGWCGGDFSADGFTDVSDFGLWNVNRFQSAGAASVPDRNSAPSPIDDRVHAAAVGDVAVELTAQRLDTASRRPLPLPIGRSIGSWAKPQRGAEPAGGERERDGESSVMHELALLFTAAQ